MNFKIIALSALSALCCISCTEKNNETYDADLNYTLLYIPEAQKVHVKLKYHPVQNDSTVLVYGNPMFGGQIDIFDGFQNAVSSAEMKVDKDNHLIIVYHQGDEAIELEYDIIDTQKEGPNVASEMFRPMIQQDYFFCHGMNLFLQPQVEREMTQSVRWQSLPNFPLLASFDPANRGDQVTIKTVEQSLMSIITGGKGFDIVEIPIGDTNNYLGFKPNGHPDVTTEKVKGYFETAYSAMCDFWQDPATRPFTLVIAPFQHTNHSMSGTALIDCFSSKYNPDTKILLTENNTHTLTHEIGHHWIGMKITLDERHQWFGEGFNDYLTYWLNTSKGFRSEQGFEEEFNKLFENYFGSEIRDTPNDSILTHFWEGGDYTWLPYWRGTIFAFCLDGLISHQSDGKQSLRDFMLTLKQKAEANGEGKPLSLETFIETLALFLPETEVNSLVHRHMIDGQPLRLDKVPLIPGCKITYENQLPHITITDPELFISHFK
jgi:predicted metalloprotease with PDZ domain